MTDQDAPSNTLSRQDEAVLRLISEGYTYKEIGQVFSITPANAHQWVSEVRRRFAEWQTIPLETLHIKAYTRNSESRPRLGEEERQLLEAYLANTAPPPLPPDFAEHVLKKLTVREPFGPM